MLKPVGHLPLHEPTNAEVLLLNDPHAVGVPRVLLKVVGDVRPDKLDIKRLVFVIVLDLLADEVYSLCRSEGLVLLRVVQPDNIPELK